MLLTTGREPVLSWYRLDGTCFRRISLDIPVRPLTDKEKNDYLARLVSGIEEEEKGARQNLRNAVKAMVFTETKGCWSSVQVDDAGYIWLQVPESRDERRAAGGGYQCRLLSPEGEYLGITRLPFDWKARFRLSRGLLTMRRYDPDTGEIIIAAFRIRPAVPGLRYP